MFEITDEERISYLDEPLERQSRLWKVYRNRIVGDDGMKVDPKKLMHQLILAPHRDRGYLYKLGCWNHGRKYGFYDSS